jgi:hypothetical protein
MKIPRSKKLPTGATAHPWHIYEETWKNPNGSSGTRAVVRRNITLPDGRVARERMPKHLYAHLRGNRDELESFVRRTNAELFKEEISIEKILDRNAFLSVQTLEKFQAHLAVHTPSPEKVTREMTLLKKYVVNVFVAEFRLLNPKDWYAERDRWYGYLLSDKAPASAYTKKYIIQVANKFMKWLHGERETEMPLYVFDGFSVGKLSSIERQRAIAGEKKIRNAISEADWKRIHLALPEDIRPWIMLSYSYGLRRNESLGLLFEGTDCVYQSGIELKRQLIRHRAGKMKFKELKTEGRSSIESKKRQEMRFIPHWFATPEQACDWIETGSKKPLSPNGLTKKWNRLMKSLGMSYDIHELRHTWVTNALASGHNPREVQLAAGHVNLETTMRYAHDHRSGDRVRFRPKKAS